MYFVPPYSTLRLSTIFGHHYHYHYRYYYYYYHYPYIMFPRNTY